MLGWWAQDQEYQRDPQVEHRKRIRLSPRQLGLGVAGPQSLQWGERYWTLSLTASQLQKGIEGHQTCRLHQRCVAEEAADDQWALARLLESQQAAGLDVAELGNPAGNLSMYDLVALPTAAENLGLGLSAEAVLGSAQEAHGK
jgi:hypothetical protein